MRRTGRLAAAVLGAGLVLVSVATAAPASAGGIFDGAGYKMTGIHTMTLTFAMPAVSCPATGEREVDLGLFAPDHSWSVGASASCSHGTRFYGSFVETNGRGTGAGSDANVAGDRFRVQLIRQHGRTRLTVTDLDVPGDTDGASTRQDTSVVAAGANAFIGGIPKFTDTTMRVSGNGGQQFTAFDPVRHALYRDDTKLIGSGFPWNDGYHFTLYFKHA